MNISKKNARKSGKRHAKLFNKVSDDSSAASLVQIVVTGVLLVLGYKRGKGGIVNTPQIYAIHPEFMSLQAIKSGKAYMVVKSNDTSSGAWLKPVDLAVVKSLNPEVGAAFEAAIEAYNAEAGPTKKASKKGDISALMSL